MFNEPSKFILASTSFIRRQMIEELNFDVKFVDSEIDETKIKLLHSGLCAADLALILSDEKARVISKKYPNKYVIGADQIGIFKKELMHKTTSTNECIEQLKILENDTHQLFTATSLFYNSSCLWHTSEQVNLSMKLLTINQIQDYVNKDNPLNSVGAYYYEANGAALFNKIDGEMETILGFELKKLIKYLTLNDIIV